ncbi:sensor histidine kinase, partial [uncultured Duncaniella sp.]|uniref:sensor histidine kinase n=1 Tax=uncultured Duncaniella sp. TaxID=2768039 RepID=UPI00265EA3F8
MIGTAALTANVLFAIFKNDPIIIYTEHSFERFLFMVTGIGLFGYVLAILTKFTSRTKESLNAKEWALILSVLAISSLIIGAIHIVILNGDTDRSNIILLTASEVGIIFINILCLSITSSLNETHKREESLLFDKKRNEYSQRYAESIKEQYDQTRRLRHDMKQYVASMAALIKGKKYDAAEEFAEKQAETLSSVETVVNVENDFMNAILNTKLTLAKTKGIDVICSVERDISGIEDIDLCNLLGNLLDNAICAAEKCDLESRLVEVKISAV